MSFGSSPLACIRILATNPNSNNHTNSYHANPEHPNSCCPHPYHSNSSRSHSSNGVASPWTRSHTEWLTRSASSVCAMPNSKFRLACSNAVLPIGHVVYFPLVMV